MPRFEIVVTLRFEATHCWPTCPLKGVAFLRHPHRHVFHIRIQAPVTHTDRDLEIIEFKRAVLLYLEERYPSRDLGSMSCEQLAQELLVIFEASMVEVLEDGENGAVAIKE